MMRILLAVTDSPAGLAAARSAIHFAKQSGGQVRAVHVLGEPGVEHRPRQGAPRLEADHQRTSDTASVLDYVTGLGQRAGVQVEAVTLHGQPARAILDQASAWQADVIVLGRSGVRHVGQPFVGSQVLHVLEFAEIPVVVVPT